MKSMTERFPAGAENCDMSFACPGSSETKGTHMINHVLVDRDESDQQTIYDSQLLVTKHNCEIMYKYVNSCHETRLPNFKFTHTGDDSEFYVYGGFLKWWVSPTGPWENSY